MSSLPLPEISVTEVQKTFDALTALIDGFITAWESGGEAPCLADIVPASPASYRRLALVELIKVDLDYRWKRGKARQVEDYLHDFPELHEGGIPCDLLYEEYHIRKQAGDKVDAQEYLVRFPSRSEELKRLFNVQSRSTSILAKTRFEDLKPGEKLDDFDLLKLLGQGAFAKVFLAWQGSMQRQVAVKISADQGSEPQTLAQLDHPHIVRVYDQRHMPEQKLLLLYMQPIVGGTLQHVIAHTKRVPLEQRSGKTFLEAVDLKLKESNVSPVESSGRDHFAALSWPEVVRWIGMRLADALDYAARQGVLHRDVKPANVLVTPEGQPLLTDFNVSFSSKLEGANPSAFFGGSLAYMAPEHLDATNPESNVGPEELDGRSDLYSLGVMLWELLIGERPFGAEELSSNWGKTLESLAARRRVGPPLENLPPSIPHGLKDVLAKCLAPQPKDRWSSGRELVRALALSLEERALQLLAPEPPAWVRLVRRSPTLALLLAGLWPNVLAALFNLVYNAQEIVVRLPVVWRHFWGLQFAINGVAFPLGIVVFIVLCRPVALAIESPEPTHDAKVRRRCLAIGHYLAMVCLAEWLIAGLGYPCVLAIAVGGLPWTVYLHFLASLALCGLIASVYPFFCLTFLSVRALYPRLALADAADVEEFTVLRRRMSIYLLLAAVVPMLGVCLLVVIGSESRLALGVLSSAGLVGFGLIYWLFRQIQTDMDTLTFALRPAKELLQSTKA